jgi:two-component system phosphate regulon sensor histidine kinase PhoR
MTTMLAEHVDGLADGFQDLGLPRHLKILGEKTNMRFTLITDQGVVVADSITGTQDIGPHGTREEVLIAKENGVGFSERYSSTLDQQMMYLARRYQPLDSETGTRDRNRQGGFVRIATPSESINSAILSIQIYVWSFAISLGVLTAILMAIFSERNMRPLGLFSKLARRIGVGQYDRIPELHFRDDEWGDLGAAFRQMQTELTTREVRLTQNSQRLEAVLSSMIEGVIAIDATGKVMLANGAACKMFSLTRPALLGRRLLEIIRIPELTAAIEKTQLQRTYSRTEFKTLSDPQRTLKARVSMLADQNESGVAVILHDVTELRQLETMRQDFVANVSHELKTPLSSIKAYAETLRMGAINDQAKNMSFVENIEFQAELLNRQIQDLLQLARVESGKTTFQLANVDINEICESCYQQFSEIAREHQLELIVDLAEEGPVARCDAAALETIAKNLVVNAIHYTPAGGSVTISSGREERWAVLSVIDNGIGIAPDHQSRVFERFYRVDKARSRDMGGTGLGLAIVKHLTQSFGGSVQLTSQLGKGSRFQIRLPLA